MIIGETVYLTALDPENIETVRGWINDPQVHEWMLAGHVPVSKGEEGAFFDKAQEPDSYHFEIWRLDDRRMIGVCGLQHVDMVHRHAEIGIVVGDIGSQSKGHGADAIRTLARFAFEVLGMHTVQIGYIDGNERAAHLYRRLGFKDAGRLREFHFIRGRFRDAVLLDMTRDEFDAMPAEETGSEADAAT